MSAFDRALAHVFAAEGGYVNDPADPGGETKFGISKRAYPDVDIAALTREGAAAIYRRDYWDACRCDGLPPAIALAVFDAAVNQGARAAAIMLQQSAGAPVDGIVGPVTMAAAHRADARTLLVYFMAERALRYARTGNFNRFGRGWMRRAFDTALTAVEEV